MLSRMRRTTYSTAQSYVYQVPDRRIPLRRHIPAGRTLHIVDIENLMGGPKLGRETLHLTSVCYRQLSQFAASDLAIVAANPGVLMDVAAEWKGSQMLSGRGPNGADMALLTALRETEEIASRFDRVIIGSGDGIFTQAVRDIQQMGIAVGVVGREYSVSMVLRRRADFVCLIQGPSHTFEAA